MRVKILNNISSMNRKKYIKNDYDALSKDWEVIGKDIGYVVKTYSDGIDDEMEK